MWTNSLTESQRFILLSIAFLVPVSAFILNWLLYFLGKLTINKLILPKLRKNSKLRFRIKELVYTDATFLYVETGIADLCVIFWALLILIKLF